MTQTDSPTSFPGVMISGTFKDIREHRNILRDALERNDLHPVDMQNYVVGANDDIISSSLEMVQKGSAYIGLISHRYGHIPDDPRNPKKHSITRMEFEKAQELGRPTLIFVMGDDHDVKKAHVELDAAKIQKLEEFIKRVKDRRVYVTFNSTKEFEKEALLAVGKLKTLIEEKAAESIALLTALPEPVPAETVATTEFDPNFPCFNIPFRSKGDGVIGRDGILEKIQREFQKDVVTPVGKLVALVGLGGLGKTQLAVEYAYRYRDEYPGGVVWLGADEDIDSQLTSLSEESKWVSPVSDHKTKLDVALNRIRSRSDCLIVFDNLEDFNHIRPYLPRIDAAPHLLLTSQREILGVPSIDVDFLDPFNSRALLVREAGGSPSVDNESEVVEILEHLDGLPLALEMAGAYIKRLNLDWKTYLSQLKERPRRTLKGTPLGSFTNHDPDVFATLRVSERVLDDEPFLREAIDVLTWSGPADMGIGLLSSLVNCTEDELMPSLITAVNVRLIRRHPKQDRYSLHRLLQLARQENAEVSNFEIWQGNIGQRLGDWFEKRREDFTDLVVFEAEFDHLVAWQHRSAFISNELNAKLIWLQAYPPYHRGRNQQSHELVSEAASIMDRTSGEHSTLKANILGDFGFTKHALGDYHKALELKQKALDIRRATLGDDHPDTATAYGNLGSTFSALGTHDKALELKQKSLDIRRATLGEDHPDTATAYGNLGATFGDLGKFDKSQKLDQKALDIRRATLGEDHPDTATAYGNLGSTFGSLGKDDMALELKQKALNIRLATLGEDHPDTATTYGNLGVTYNNLGKHDKALELIQKALDIRRVTLGEDHPDTATVYANLGVIYSSLGKHDKALELIQKALDIRRVTLGEDHPDTAAAYGNLGSTFDDLGKHDKALQLKQKALDIQCASLGENHPDTASAYRNLGATFGALGKHDKALQLKQKALVILRATLGENHPATVSACESLGVTYYSLSKYSEALELEQKAHQFYIDSLGNSHVKTRNSAIHIAMTLSQLHRIKEATSALKEAVHSLPISDPIYKRALKISKELKKKKIPRGPRYTPPKKRRKKRRR